MIPFGKNAHKECLKQLIQNCDLTNTIVIAKSNKFIINFGIHINSSTLTRLSYI